MIPTTPEAALREAILKLPQFPIVTYATAFGQGETTITVRLMDVLAAIAASPEPPVEVTSDPALGFDLASKIAGWLRVYGHFVPDNQLRTILISIKNYDAKLQAASPEPRETPAK